MPRRARVTTKNASAGCRQSAARDFSNKKKLQRRKALRRRISWVMSFMMVIAASVQYTQWKQSGTLDEIAALPFNLWHHAMVGLGFELQQVVIVGRNVTDQQRLQEALNVMQGSSVFAADLEALKQRVEDIPEVRFARVRRELPSQLKVELIERKPAVIWQQSKKQVLMDEEGVVLDTQKYDQHQSRLVVVGRDVPEELPHLLKLLRAEPALMRDVRAAVRVGERRWNLRLKGDVTVMLPEEGATHAWKRFAHLVKHEALLAQKIKRVDLRLSDRVFVLPDQTSDPKVIFSSAQRT